MVPSLRRCFLRSAMRKARRSASLEGHGLTTEGLEKRAVERRLLGLAVDAAVVFLLDPSLSGAIE